jgi:starch synthase
MGLKVLIVASEVSPYAKSGGLGDVTGSLPKALQSRGVDVRVVFPKYRTIKEDYLRSCEYISSFNVTLDWRTQKADIFRIGSATVPTYMIGNDYYFGRGGYYGYGDDNERFAFFCKASIEFLDYIDFVPDVIHCNDWQTGPISIYVKDVYSKLKIFENIKTVYTIHNIQYQGIFTRDTLRMMDLNDGYFVNDKMEFHNMVNYMKAGLLYSDMVTTVSDTYAKEIQTPQYAYGLEGVLQCRSNYLCGIVNGIDYSLNDPATSTKIYKNFDINSLENKTANKLALQEELGLPVRADVPMLAIISRLVDQKGINLVLQAANELLYKDIQLVILGTGDSHYEGIFKDLGYRYSDKVSANILFDDTLAQKIYASSDIFLMPSLFEPCGLGQLFAMSYGTIPVARATGGLVDTVKHYNYETGEGTGFLFNDYDCGGLMWGINEALNVYYNDKERWNGIVKNAISERFSWENSADKYIRVYKKITGKE